MGRAVDAPLPEIGDADLLARVGGLRIPSVDGVVAVERGGSTPGRLVAGLLNLPLGRLRISYRDESNSISTPEPVVVSRADIPPGDHLLVVDDVSVTGATLGKARRVLAPRLVTTLVMIGDADLVAFPEIESCVRWAWSKDL